LTAVAIKDLDDASASSPDDLADADAGPEEVAGVENGAPPPAAPAFREPKSLRTILADLRHPEPTLGPDGRPRSTKEVVNGLDRRERTYGAVLMVLDLALTIGLFLSWRHDKNVKLLHAAPDVLIVGLIGVACIALGVGLARRALLGFASFIVGMAFISFGLIEGMVYLFFGGWLITRVMRKQRQDSPRARAARPAAGRTTKKAPAPRTPVASKRYTPPRRTKTTAKGR
jgi:hypothetical protein